MRPRSRLENVPAVQTDLVQEQDTEMDQCVSECP